MPTPANVEKARQYLHGSLRLYGPVSVEQWKGTRLPYNDNLVNLLVAEDLGGVTMDEVLRVLAPNGVAYIRHGGQWTKTVKPRPAEHGRVDALPARPEQQRRGPRLRSSARRGRCSGSAARAIRGTTTTCRPSARWSPAGGRNFYIFDEATRASILTPPQWFLTGPRCLQRHDPLEAADRRVAHATSGR